MERGYVEANDMLRMKMLATDGECLELVRDMFATCIKDEARLDKMEDQLTELMTKFVHDLNEMTKSDAEMLTCLASAAIDLIMTLHYGRDMIMMHRELNEIEKG